MLAAGGENREEVRAVWKRGARRTPVEPDVLLAVVDVAVDRVLLRRAAVLAVTLAVDLAVGRGVRRARGVGRQRERDCRSQTGNENCCGEHGRTSR